ncbi:MAG: hypothetical protein ACD_21C00267G0010 [uncultured bacterium]|nr:MAG: hypothetical protein ACD_21C00267G0010 [uncultured bacterium]
MSKVTVYLSDNVFQNLKNISHSSGKAVSKISAELIESNIENYCGNQKNGSVGDNKKMAPHEKNHYANLVVTLNIAMEILKKLNNEPSKYEGKNAEFIATTVKNMALDKLSV